MALATLGWHARGFDSGGTVPYKPRLRFCERGLVAHVLYRSRNSSSPL